MRIATTTVDFFDYVPRGDAARAVRLTAECGFRHIDLSMDFAYFEGSPMCSDGWEKWVDEIRRAGEESNVDFVQAHASDSAFEAGPDRDYRMDMLRRQLRICAMLGIPGMVVHGICGPKTTREEFMEVNAAMYRELLPAAEETGVRIYTENTCSANCPTYFLFEGRDFNELRERVNHPLFGCCWDVGHANVQKVDQYRCITDMGDGLMAVHVHDNDGCRDDHQAPFAGNTCYDAVICGLKEIGFKGCFTLEAFSLPTPRNFCFCNRPSFTALGPECDKLGMLPLEFKMKSERFMLETTRYMLQAHNCLEE